MTDKNETRFDALCKSPRSMALGMVGHIIEILQQFGKEMNLPEYHLSEHDFYEIVEEETKWLMGKDNAN